MIKNSPFHLTPPRKARQFLKHAGSKSSREKVEKQLGRTRSVSRRMRHALLKEQPQNPTARMRLTLKDDASRNRSEYARISNPGGGSQAAGFARLKGRHAATTEKSRQARSATQTDNLAQKRFRQRETHLQDSEIKNSPRHESVL